MFSNTTCLAIARTYLYTLTRGAFARWPKKSHLLYFTVWWSCEAHLLKVSLRAPPGNSMHVSKSFGHAQMCLWWVSQAHCCLCLPFNATDRIDAHNCLSGSCFLCSWNMQAFISHFDSNCLPTAELDRHHLQHDRDHSNIECTCIDFVHATGYVYTCGIKRFMQTAVAPASWSVYV